VGISFVAARSPSQSANVTDIEATPMPCAGHDSVHELNETVNPAPGSLSLRIQVPVPKGRRLTLAFAFASKMAANLFDPFFQGYDHCVTHMLPDRLANVGPYRQVMGAITQSHERSPKGVPIDCAPHLYQAAGFKELDGTRPDDIGPTPRIRTLLQFG
jgi:hypothetical protein